MKIIKPTSLGILTRAYRAGGREHLGVAIPVMVTLSETPRLVSESELWNMAGEELMAYTLDAALPKPHAEFLVSARAYGKYCDHSQACHVGIRFAGVEKHLRVSGDRYWNGDRATAARPFESLPIDWPLAYGGTGYPDNPAGRGFDGGFAEDETPRPLPNIEYAASSISSRGQHVAPAAFTPIQADWPLRSALYGQLDQQWLEQDCPGFPRTMDRRYFNVAPPDQQLPAHTALPDGAAYEITRMHPEREVMTGILPALRARCFIQRLQEDALTEVPMRLTTAWFIPHRERVVMIFHGLADIAEFDAQDVACLLVAAESHEAPRSVAHYRHVFDLRMDGKRGALHALRDSDLLPASMLARADSKSETNPAESANTLQRNLLRQARLQAERAATTTQGMGAHLALDAFAATQTPPHPPRLDELAEFVQHREQLAEQQFAELETTRRQIEAKHAARGPQASARRGPPKLSLDGTNSPHLNRADMQQSVRAADQKLRQTYLHTAHHQEAAPRLDPAAARAVRERVAAMHANGESLAGLDLTGADLSGMRLPGALLAGALLESADLTGADLTGAALSAAVLVRATLSRATFVGTRLDNANLSLAHCENTDFSDATLDGSLFERTQFQRCKLPRASIQRAQFKHCRFDTVDFSETTLSDLVFLEQVFHDVDFSKARIRKLTFVQCQIERARFSEADIAGFGLVETIANGIQFDRATLGKACFVKDTVLHPADFTQATLSEVNLRQTNAKGARFNGARASQCDFSDARLHAADLQDMKLANGYMVRTDLSGANLARADLIGVTLRRANLRGANFCEANLFRANLAETLTDRATQFDGAYLEQAVLRPLARPA